jgi:hypothetical protein
MHLSRRYHRSPGFPVAEVLPLASGDSLVKQPNDVIAGEVEVTPRLCRGLVVTGDDCVAIETDEVCERLANATS